MGILGSRGINNPWNFYLSHHYCRCQSYKYCIGEWIHSWDWRSFLSNLFSDFSINSFDTESTLCPDQSTSGQELEESGLELLWKSSKSTYTTSHCLFRQAAITIDLPVLRCLSLTFLLVSLSNKTLHQPNYQPESTQQFVLWAHCELLCRPMEYLHLMCPCVGC